jgi:glycosyltransferase involved in cell wall biosynthesis
MRVIHITNNDYDGAGLAVMRLHNQLLLQGVDSNVALVFSSGKNANKKIIRIGYGETIRQFLLDIITFKIFIKHKQYIDIFYYLLIRINEKVFKVFYRPKNLFNFNYGISRYYQLKKYIFNNDVVVLHSIQGILNPIDIVKIQEEFKVKIVMRPLDMELITGGCHFNYQCMKWQQKCGTCPQLKSNKLKDVSNRAFIDKKNSYSNIPIHWIAPNSFIQNRLSESPILSSNHKVSTIFLGVEKDRYKFISQSVARGKFNLPSDKKIILFGCFNLSDERKGAALLYKVLKNSLDKQCIKDTCLVTFGTLNGFSFNGIGLDWIHLEELTTDIEMNYLYRSADLLVSPSLNDLGPAIVVEAFMNDLPIVSFNLGVAMDVVINDVNGNLIECFNLKKFGLSISNIIMNGLENFTINREIKRLHSQCELKEEALIFIEKCL